MIALTVGELIQIRTKRLAAAPPVGPRLAQASEARLDTWQTASLLGIHPRRALAPEPPPGPPRAPERLTDDWMRLALLLTQGRTGAMMALGAEAFTAETSEATVQHALTLIERYRDLYPDEARATAK